DDFRRRIDGPGHVRHVRYRYERHVGGEQASQPIEINSPRPIDRRVPDLADLAPREEVRVMLGQGDDDIARTLQGPADQVDPLGGVANEDDLAFAASEEAGNVFTRLLVTLAGLLGEPVRPSVDIRTIINIEICDTSDDIPGFLSGRRVVEIDHGLPVDSP